MCSGSSPRTPSGEGSIRPVAGFHPTTSLQGQVKAKPDDLGDRFGRVFRAVGVTAQASAATEPAADLAVDPNLGPTEPDRFLFDFLPYLGVVNGRQTVNQTTPQGGLMFPAERHQPIQLRFGLTVGEDPGLTDVLAGSPVLNAIRVFTQTFPSVVVVTSQFGHGRFHFRSREGFAVRLCFGFGFPDGIPLMFLRQCQSSTEHDV